MAFWITATAKILANLDRRTAREEGRIDDKLNDYRNIRWGAIDDAIAQSYKWPVQKAMKRLLTYNIKNSNEIWSWTLDHFDKHFYYIPTWQLTPESIVFRLIVVHLNIFSRLNAVFLHCGNSVPVLLLFKVLSYFTFQVNYAFSQKIHFSSNKRKNTDKIYFI